MEKIRQEYREYFIEVLRAVDEYTSYYKQAPRPIDINKNGRFSSKAGIQEPTFYSRLQMMRREGLLIKNKPGQGTRLFITLQGYSIIEKEKDRIVNAPQVEKEIERATKELDSVFKDVLIDFTKEIIGKYDRDFTIELIEGLEKVLYENNPGRA